MVRRYDSVHRSTGWSLAIALLVTGLLLLPCLARAEPRAWLLGDNTDPAGYAPFSTYVDCNDPAGVKRFYVYVRSDVALTGITTLELDFQIYSTLPVAFCGHELPPAMSPFWRFGADDCNDGGLMPSSEPPANTYGYRSMWGNLRVSPYSVAAMRDTLREMVIAVWSTSTAVALEANRTYYVGQLLLPKCASAACTGCDASVDMVVTDASAYGNAAGYSFGYTELPVNLYGICGTAPPPDPADLRAIRQLKPVAVMSTRSACDVVAVRRDGWGRLKQLYR